MKMKRSLVLAKSTPTLTQSGLLAVLLQRQRQRVIELAEHRAHANQPGISFSSALTWLGARIRGAIAGRPLHGSVGRTLHRHP